MFQAFWMGIQSCVSRRAAPGLETQAILNGPSHMGESLCSPLQDVIAHLEHPGADAMAVVPPQRLLVPCRSE